MSTQVVEVPLPDRTAFHHSWIRALLVLLFMAVALAGWASLAPQGIPPLHPRTAVRIAIVLFVIGAANFLWLEFSPKPILVVDAAGVLIPKLSSTPIPWSEISAVHRRHLPRRPLIWFELREPEHFIPPLGTLRGFLLRMRRGFSMPLASVETFLMKGSSEEAVAIIERYRAQASGESSSRR